MENREKELTEAEAGIAGENSAELYALGNLYLLGLGLPEDSGRALYFYEKAAAAGNAAAMFQLYLMDEEGKGRGLYWLEQAAERDNPEALKALAEKKAGQEDYEAARGLYLRAAEQGDREAMACAGLFLYYGYGGETDREQAESWFKKAGLNIADIA